MSEHYLSVKEFAKAAGVSPQTLYKQISKENSRLAPYIQEEKGQKRISSAALKVFYDIEEDENQPKSTETTERQPETTRNQSNSTERQPETTLEDQPKTTDKEAKTALEKRIEELEKLLNEQIETDKQEREFLKDQIRQKDKTIENLTENLRMAQQLHAADKKKLLEIEQKQQDLETVEADQEVITPAAPAADQDQKEQEKAAAEGKGIKAFFRRLFS